MNIKLSLQYAQQTWGGGDWASPIDSLFRSPRLCKVCVLRFHHFQRLLSCHLRSG